MPRVIQTTVYLYNELTPKAQAVARQWYREGEAGNNDFAESLTDKGCDFETVAKLLGWSISNAKHREGSLAIYWSGFSSQGDGLCFEGDWKAGNVDAAGLKAHAPLDTELHRLADAYARLASEFPSGTGISEHAGRYSHEYSVVLDFGSDGEVRINPTEAMKQAFTNESRALMRWMYRALEAEHDYQNSDVQVTDAIVSNEYEFLENGKRA